MDSIVATDIAIVTVTTMATDAANATATIYYEFVLFICSELISKYFPLQHNAQQTVCLNIRWFSACKCKEREDTKYSNVIHCIVV